MPKHQRRQPTRSGVLPEEILYSEAVCTPQDVFYEGSEDEDYVDSITRRRRYEAAGRRYLDGNVPHLLSASLRGPFGRASGWANPWLGNRLVASPATKDPNAIITDGSIALKKPDLQENTDDSFECHLPSPESLKQAPVIESGHSLSDDKLKTVRSWREAVLQRSDAHFPFGETSHTRLSATTSKRKAKSSSWLRRVEKKKRKKDDPTLVYEATPPNWARNKLCPLPDPENPRLYLHAASAEVYPYSSSQSRKGFGRKFLRHPAYHEDHTSDQDELANSLTDVSFGIGLETSKRVRKCVPPPSHPSISNSKHRYDSDDELSRDDAAAAAFTSPISQRHYDSKACYPAGKSVEDFQRACRTAFLQSLDEPLEDDHPSECMLEAQGDDDAVESRESCDSVTPNRACHDLDKPTEKSPRLRPAQTAEDGPEPGRCDRRLISTASPSPSADFPGLESRLRSSQGCLLQEEEDVQRVRGTGPSETASQIHEKPKSPEPLESADNKQVFVEAGDQNRRQQSSNNSTETTPPTLAEPSANEATPLETDPILDVRTSPVPSATEDSCANSDSDHPGCTQKSGAAPTPRNHDSACDAENIAPAVCSGEPQQKTLEDGAISVVSLESAGCCAETVASGPLAAEMVEDPASGQPNVDLSAFALPCKPKWRDATNVQTTTRPAGAIRVAVRSDNGVTVSPDSPWTDDQVSVQGPPGTDGPANGDLSDIPQASKIDEGPASGPRSEIESSSPCDQTASPRLAVVPTTTHPSRPCDENHQTPQGCNPPLPPKPRFPTPEPQFAVKSFASFMAPSPERTPHPGQARLAVATAMKSSRRRSRTSRRVSWALPPQTDDDDTRRGADLEMPDATLAADQPTKPRQVSPPPVYPVSDLPTSRDAKFHKHFAAVASREEDGPRTQASRLLSEAGLQSPGLMEMAETFLAADQAPNGSPVAAASARHSQLPEAETEEAPPESPSSTDLVEDVFREMSELLQTWDVEAELQKARMPSSRG